MYMPLAFEKYEVSYDYLYFDTAIQLITSRTIMLIMWTQLTIIPVEEIDKLNTLRIRHYNVAGGSG